MAYDAALLLHLLLLTYWLGADLGVFYSSRYVLRADLPPASRSVALKIMAWLDVTPRLCLVLFLPSGVTLMALDDYGRDLFAGWPLVAVWIASLGWLGLVLADHLMHDSPLHGLVRRLDLAVRFGVVAVLLGSATYALVASAPFGVDTNPKWLGGKVALYAVAIACGIAIRFQLKPFAAAFGALVTTGSTPAVERDLRGAIVGSQPYVAAIWLCVLGSAVLGVFKPGANV
jgi:hypothetical protein